MQYKEKKVGYLIGLILLFLIALGIGITGLVINMKEENNGENDNTQLNENVELKEHLISLNGINKGESITKTIGKFNIKIILNEYENDVYTFDIYVNDNYFINDSLFSGSKEITFTTLKDNLVYKNTGYTDVRSEKIYIIDDNTNITEIYELESAKGMVPSDIEVTTNGITIKASRLDHGPSIIYNNYFTSDGVVYIDNNKLEKVEETSLNDINITAKYFYKFENNRFNTVPVISDIVKYEEYIKNNPTIIFGKMGGK